jgi:PKD repeat protein
VIGEAGINVTNPSTILPMQAVFVNCHGDRNGSTFTDDQLLNAKIAWDFGDPGSKHDSDLIGWNAAHPYASAGSYTITLTITFPNGQNSVATANVTVGTDTRTTVVNLTGGSLAMPTAVSPMSNETIVLGNGTLGNYYQHFSVAGLTNVYIKAAMGATPVVYSSSPNIITTEIDSNSLSAGITIQGLTFDADASQFPPKHGMTLENLAAVAPVGNDGFTMLDCTFKNLGNAVLMQNTTAQGVLVENCSESIVQGLQQYFAIASDASSELNFIDDSSLDSSDQALFRFIRNSSSTEPQDILISGCTLDKTGAINGKNDITMQDAHYFEIANCTLIGGLGKLGGNPTPNDPTSGCSIKINPNHSTSNSYGRIESNLITNGHMEIDGSSSIQPKHYFISNNVLQQNNLGDGTTMIIMNIVSSRPITDVQIYHNTFYQLTSSGSSISEAGGEAANVIFDDNYFYPPNMTISDNGLLAILDPTDMNGFAEWKGNLFPTITSTIPPFLHGWCFPSWSPGCTKQLQDPYGFRVTCWKHGRFPKHCPL